MKPEPLLYLHPLERYEQPLAEYPEPAGFTNTWQAWLWKGALALVGLAMWMGGLWLFFLYWMSR